MALTETPGIGTDRGGSRNKVKRLQVIDFDTLASEKIIAVIRIDGLGKKTIMYDNRSVAQNHTLKVYVTLRSLIPDAVADTHMKLIKTVTVNLTTTSDPVAFHNEYYWMVVTIESAGVETDISDLYFIGTNNG